MQHKKVVTGGRRVDSHVSLKRIHISAYVYASVYTYTSICTYVDAYLFFTAISNIKNTYAYTYAYNVGLQLEIISLGCAKQIVVQRHSFVCL